MSFPKERSKEKQLSPVAVPRKHHENHLSEPQTLKNFTSVFNSGVESSMDEAPSASQSPLKERRHANTNSTLDEYASQLMEYRLIPFLGAGSGPRPSKVSHLNKILGF